MTLELSSQNRQRGYGCRWVEDLGMPTEYPLGDDEIINPVVSGNMFSAEVAIKLFEGLSME